MAENEIVIEPKEMVKCPHCSRLWDDDIEASECCPDENERYSVCPICTKDVKRLTDYGTGVFDDEQECLDHIAKEHRTGTVDEYIEALRFSNAPVLDLQQRYIDKTDYLIPMDEIQTI